MNRTTWQCLLCGRDLVQRDDGAWVPFGKRFIVICDNNWEVEDGPHEPIGPDHELWETR